MPPLAERGSEPQVLAFELDVLAERFRASLFDKSLHTAARPGLIEAGQRLRERFLVRESGHVRNPQPRWSPFFFSARG